MLLPGGIRQPYTQNIAAVPVAGGHAALTARRLVFRTQYEELARPGLAPCLFPLGVRWESIFCEMKLGVEQLLGAEAEVNLAGFSLRFQLFATDFQTRQAPPLLMQPVRARHAFRWIEDSVLNSLPSAVQERIRDW